MRNLFKKQVLSESWRRRQPEPLKVSHFKIQNNLQFKKKMNFSISNRSSAINLTMNTNFDVVAVCLFVCLFFHYLMSSSKLSPSPFFFHFCSPTCFSLWESNRWPLNDFMSSAKFEAELDASETHRTQENKVKWIQWAHTWFGNSGFCILTLYC